MDTTRMRSLIHPNSISLLTFFEASPTEKYYSILHIDSLYFTFTTVLDIFIMYFFLFLKVSVMFF